MCSLHFKPNLSPSAKLPEISPARKFLLKCISEQTRSSHDKKFEAIRSIYLLINVTRHIPLNADLGREKFKSIGSYLNLHLNLVQVKARTSLLSFSCKHF